MKSNIVSELTTRLEAIFDRWENAFAAVRAEDYTTADWAKDVAEGWMDATYLAMLPAARLGGLKLETSTRLPVARFIVTDTKTPMTQVIRVDTGSDPVKDALTKRHGASIDAKHYSVTLAVDGARYLYVTLNCRTIPRTPAGVYEGRVTDKRSRDDIANVIVVWPG